MRALFLVNDRGGCAYYRVRQPGRILRDLNLADVHLHEKGAGPEVFAHLLAWAEVVFLGRIGGKALLKIVRNLHDEGKAVVIDLDDDLLNVSPLNEHYRDYGLEEIFIDMDGEHQPLWVDVAKADEYKGLDPCRFIDLEQNLANARCMESALNEADAVSVTTEILAEDIRRYNPNVFVLPNCIDLSKWQPLDLNRHDELSLGWCGGISHFEDLNIIKQPLHNVMHWNPKLKLKIQGSYFKSVFNGIDQERIQVDPWVDCDAHPYRSAIVAPSLAVIPLVDNHFNRRKSPVKWLEYASLGVPCICSNMPPYDQVVVPGVNGDLAKTPDHFEYLMQCMISDTVHRAKMSDRALKTVKACFDAHKKAPLWIDCLESAMDNRKRQAA